MKFGSDVLIGTTPTITASLAESPPGPSTGTFRVLRGRSGLGTTVLSLYNPDLNPIEHQWVQTKVIRRQYRYEVDTLSSEHLPYDKL